MDRHQIIHSLVRFDLPLEALRALLSGLEWDWPDAPLAVVRRENILSVLRRWQAGELTKEDVEEWASLVEVRDDLDHNTADPAVADTLFDLANPLLEGTLDELAPGLFVRLQR
jgi:hypothetical protein